MKQAISTQKHPFMYDMKSNFKLYKKEKNTIFLTNEFLPEKRPSSFTVSGPYLSIQFNSIEDLAIVCF